MADDCPPLTLITSVNMKFGDDSRAYVPVQIGGVAKSMLVDTGGFFTEMSQTAANELNLPQRHTRLQLIRVSGQKMDTAVQTSLVLGNLRSDVMDFMVDPDNDYASDVPDAAGVLAPNLLRGYDVDFDFANRKFNLISQNHCEGKVVYWPSDSVAVVPIRMSSSGHILVPIVLDGHRMTATLDTGASTSVVNLATAQSELGIATGTADTPAVDYLGSPKNIIYRHTFQALSLEGLSVANPTMNLVPDLAHDSLMDPHDSLEHDTRIRDTSVDVGIGDMILGMDILRRLHVYIAYKEQKLYITAAAPPTQTATSSTGTVGTAAGTR